MRMAPEVAAALERREPVVALETSIVAQGLPYPHNLEAAAASEAAVRARGATPATIAVLDGVLRVGLAAEEVERLARPGAGVRKLSSRDLGPALAVGATGATTVAATLRVASMTGIRFLATGGIGGVHRGCAIDQSADLFELARSPVAVFCSGPKTILDVAATLERLESLCVPVLGYGCDQCPAFYVARSGCPVSQRVDDPGGTARVLAAVWATGGAGVVVAVPPPEELPEAERVVGRALAGTTATGQALTPALLAEVERLSAGRSLAVNLKLVANNAALAAACAAAMARGDAG
ncbi:MAG TPA: pseudouridine-5'-phosphate glycosidase [Candidatus Dormibacteraeota bacterium]|nr:pseudouridine-5'-phosphate glycosidase [Candidatus Dormibacteraeota bacterium]